MKKGFKVVRGDELERNMRLHDIDCPRHGKLKLNITIIDSYHVDIEYHVEERLKFFEQLPPPIKAMFNTDPVFLECVKVNFFERALGITLNKKISKALVRIKKRLLKEGEIYSKHASEIEKIYGG